jgi:hypothetical protein
MRLLRVEMLCWLSCCLLMGAWAGCNTKPPASEPEAVKSELKQLEEMRNRERTNQ